VLEALSCLAVGQGLDSCNLAYPVACQFGELLLI